MRNLWYLVRWRMEDDGVAYSTEDSCTIPTEEGDGLDTILGEILRGVVDKTLEVTMVEDDGKDD